MYFITRSIKVSGLGKYCRRFWPYLANLLLLMPSLYWIANDRSVWPWDMAWYGEVSVDLWFTLTNQSAQWLTTMIGAFGSKAPGIAWLGQFFVPVGQLIGSIEFGLLCLIIAAQFGTLTLTYKIWRAFIPDSKDIPLLGSLLVSSAPLFIAMSHQFLTEALQLFAATYFYWIAAKSPSWTPLRTCGHLLLAAGLALLAKVSSPIYCFLPGIIALYDVFKRRTMAGSSSWFNSSDFSLFVLGSIVFGSTAAWYIRNFASIKVNWQDMAKISGNTFLVLKLL